MFKDIENIRWLKNGKKAVGSDSSSEPSGNINECFLDLLNNTLSNRVNIEAISNSLIDIQNAPNSTDIYTDFPEKIANSLFVNDHGTLKFIPLSVILGGQVNIGENSSINDILSFHLTNGKDISSTGVTFLKYDSINDTFGSKASTINVYNNSYASSAYLNDLILWSAFIERYNLDSLSWISLGLSNSNTTYSGGDSACTVSNESYSYLGLSYNFDTGSVTDFSSYLNLHLRNYRIESLEKNGSDLYYLCRYEFSPGTIFGYKYNISNHSLTTFENLSPFRQFLTTFPTLTGFYIAGGVGYNFEKILPINFEAYNFMDNSYTTLSNTPFAFYLSCADTTSLSNKSFIFTNFGLASGGSIKTTLSYYNSTWLVLSDRPSSGDTFQETTSNF